MKTKRLYFFIGTTTELIKLSPIIRELEKRKINFKIITSGQTKVKFEELAFIMKKKKADIELGEKTNKSSILFFAIWALSTLSKTFKLSKEFRKSKNEEIYLIVHGDPVSSLIGAIIAKANGIKLVHIESGLRSFNFLEPFPEEICRFIISKLADFHFCPNKWSLRNLAIEKGKKINTYENSMLDSFLSVPYKKQTLAKKKYFILIVHRQEHVIFRKERSINLIKTIFENMDKNMTCVFICHATTRNFLESANMAIPNEIKKRVKFVPRLSYVDFVNLLRRSEFLITDGGSNQEEAYYLGLPCLLLRKYTERIEGLGKNVVLSKEKESVISDFMKNYKKNKSPKIKPKRSPSKIIVDYLSKA